MTTKRTNNIHNANEEEDDREEFPGKQPVVLVDKKLNDDDDDDNDDDATIRRSRRKIQRLSNRAEDDQDDNAVKEDGFRSENNNLNGNPPIAERSDKSNAGKSSSVPFDSSKPTSHSENPNIDGNRSKSQESLSGSPVDHRHRDIVREGALEAFQNIYDKTTNEEKNDRKDKEVVDGDPVASGKDEQQSSREDLLSKRKRQTPSRKDGDDLIKQTQPPPAAAHSPFPNQPHNQDLHSLSIIKLARNAIVSSSLSPVEQTLLLVWCVDAPSLARCEMLVLSFLSFYFFPTSTCLSFLFR